MALKSFKICQYKLLSVKTAHSNMHFRLERVQAFSVKLGEKFFFCFVFFKVTNVIYYFTTLVEAN